MLPGRSRVVRYGIGDEKLSRTTTDLAAAFGAMAGAVTYSIIYTAADKTGTTMSCSDAWANIQSRQRSCDVRQLPDPGLRGQVSMRPTSAFAALLRLAFHRQHPIWPGSSGAEAIPAGNAAIASLDGAILCSREFVLICRKLAGECLRGAFPSLSYMWRRR